MHFTFISGDDGSDQLVFNDVTYIGGPDRDAFRDWLVSEGIPFNENETTTRKSWRAATHFYLSVKLTREQRAVIDQECFGIEPKPVPEPAPPPVQYPSRNRSVEELAAFYGPELAHQCLRKMRHAERTEAQDALKRMLAEPHYLPKVGKRLIVYSCPHCCGFHCGHAETLRCDSVDAQS